MSEQQHSPLPWGASNTRAMVVSPPPAESMRMMNEGEMPFTNIRIANCDNQNYVSPTVARANAEFIAKSCNTYYQTQELNAKLLATCEKMAYHSDEHGGGMPTVLREVLRSVIEEAKSQ